MSELKSVCLYPGSFDPFHKGHLEVAKVMSNYADIVIVIPNNPNKSKPMRSDLDTRIGIIEKTVGESKKIIVSRDTTDDTYNYYKKTSTIISVMGSDRFLSLIKLNKKPNMKADEWYIVPRNNYKLVGTYSDVNWDSQINILKNSLFSFQNGSSSTIRKKILKNSLDNMDTYIDKSVVEYIVANNIYSKKSLIDKKIKFYCKDINYIKDNIVLADIDGKHVVVKIYDNISGYMIDKKIYADNDTIKILFWYTCSEYSLIGFMCDDYFKFI